MQEACDLHMDLIRILSWECGVQFVILIQILLRLINQFSNPLLRLVKEGNLQSLDLNSPRQAVYMCEIKKEFSAAVDACKPLNTFHVLNKMYFSFLRNKFSETKVNQFFD